jgi:hypothetical protein
MSPSPEQSAQRASSAYEALASAASFVEARQAWEDFLTFLKRGLNRCDIAGKRSGRGAYASVSARVRADPALYYLWVARNAEEHGVVEIASLQEGAIAIGAFGGYREEAVESAAGGPKEFRYIPLTEDPPPFLAILPEHIKLQAVTERGTVVPVPPGYTYDLGEILAPIALAKTGLDFLEQEVAQAFGRA